MDVKRKDHHRFGKTTDSLGIRRVPCLPAFWGCICCIISARHGVFEKLRVLLTSHPPYIDVHLGD
jgi:hypothetical protein